MQIGETLAMARQQAGLSVAQVSERTRIRESIISSIEGGDYSACGGDFYARGHIRAIAKVVGADAEPLIRDYDLLHRARDGAASVVSLEELLSAAAQAPPRPGRRVSRTVILGLAVMLAAGFGLYRLLSGSPQAVAPPAVALAHPFPARDPVSIRAAAATPSPAPAEPRGTFSPGRRPDAPSGRPHLAVPPRDGQRSPHSWQAPRPLHRQPGPNREHPHAYADGRRHGHGHGRERGHGHGDETKGHGHRHADHHHGKASRHSAGGGSG